MSLISVLCDRRKHLSICLSVCLKLSLTTELSAALWSCSICAQTALDILQQTSLCTKSLSMWNSLKVLLAYYSMKFKATGLFCTFSSLTLDDWHSPLGRPLCTIPVHNDMIDVCGKAENGNRAPLSLTPTVIQPWDKLRMSGQPFVWYFD